MKIKLKRFDTTLPLPAYQSDKAAAFDLYARQTVEIPPHEVRLVPLNVALQVPPNHWVLLAARSSLFKKGLIMANGIGIGDEDFAGDQDEYQAALFNITNTTVVVTQGDRIVQALVLSRESVEIEEVKNLSAKNRSGFGSTGTR